MKIYEIIILINIKKYKKIDVLILEEELHISRVLISQIIKDLYDRKYIRMENNIPIICCDDILTKTMDWYLREEKNKEKQNFNWNYLYIPQNFSKI